MALRRKCFVIMPFRAELNFFYLFVKSHIETKFPVDVERADNRILTKPLMEKIRGQIQTADFVIGDITGRNANVFYELGLAEAWGKPAILITADPVEEAPSDVRHLEFIRYDLSRDAELLGRLDNALNNLLLAPYAALYDDALQLLKQFNADCGTSYQACELHAFQGRIWQGEKTQDIPDKTEKVATARFLLPRVIDNPSDWAAMEQITRWLAELKY